MQVKFRISNKIDESTRELLKKQAFLYCRTHDDLNQLEVKITKKLFGPYVSVLKGHFGRSPIKGAGKGDTPAQAFLKASRQLHSRMDMLETRHKIEDTIHNYSLDYRA